MFLSEVREQEIQNMFKKVNEHIGGRSIPGVVVGETTTHPVTLPNGRTIPGIFAPVISLRETNPDGDNPGQTYLTLTEENMRFTTMRFTNVIGLDVSEDGTFLTIEDLELRRAADIEARQVQRLAAQAPVYISLDD